MHVALYTHSVVPVRGYGGTQRVVIWLARGLAEHGKLFAQERMRLHFGVGRETPKGDVFRRNFDTAKLCQVPDVQIVFVQQFA